MPLSTLIPAIIGSIIEAVSDQPAPKPVVAAPAAVSVGRSIPADALFGEMQPPAAGVVYIDGRPLSLAMAAQFFNEQNNFVVAGAIRQPVAVRYLVDSTGTVYRVWLLSPAELAAAGAR
ncbi:MAG: hypothetical protein HZC24_17435 [Rhodocyclales bacterium]|nr:hypothetical protein [Rhodocyclales bacterium]